MKIKCYCITFFLLFLFYLHESKANYRKYLEEKFIFFQTLKKEAPLPPNPINPIFPNNSSDFGNNGEMKVDDNDNIDVGDLGIGHRGMNAIACDVAFIQGFVHDDGKSLPHLKLRKDAVDLQKKNKKT